MDFPTICVEDFYDNPDSIRQFALSQKYEKTDDGKWPGKRTAPLHEINPILFDQFCNKLFSIFYDFDTCGKIQWIVRTSFQLIDPLVDDPNNIKNTGWIHLDGTSAVFAGVIYLTPNANLHSGTSVFRLKNKDTIDETDAKIKYYRDGIDENYDELLKKHNSSFEETITFNNVYNRLVAWEGNQWHGVNNFYSEEPRLTQVFFVSRLEADSSSPLKRFKANYK